MIQERNRISLIINNEYNFDYSENEERNSDIKPNITNNGFTKIPKSTPLTEKPDYQDMDNPVLDRVVSMWTKVTKRPDDSPSLGEEQSEILESALSRYENSPYWELYPMVQSIALLSPSIEDESDWDRLIQAFLNDSVMEHARELSGKLNSKIITFNDVNSVSSRKRDILFELGSNDGKVDNLDSNEISALSDLSKMSENIYHESLNIAIQNNTYGGMIMPSVVVEISKDNSQNYLHPERYEITESPTQIAYDVVKNSDFSNEAQLPKTDYSDSRKIEELLYSDEMEMDSDATSMVNYGYAIDDIISFHNQAPKGYWNDVEEAVNENGGKLQQAYDKLKEKYDWHPSQREKPIRL